MDSLFYSSRGGVKTLVDYKINYEKLLFITKDLNGPSDYYRVYTKQNSSSSSFYYFDDDQGLA